MNDLERMMAALEARDAAVAERDVAVASRAAAVAERDEALALASDRAALAADLEAEREARRLAGIALREAEALAADLRELARKALEAEGAGVRDPIAGRKLATYRHLMNELATRTAERDAALAERDDLAAKLSDAARERGEQRSRAEAAEAERDKRASVDHLVDMIQKLQAEADRLQVELRGRR